ncbi:hypothetical protein IWQ61_003030 [Dispira simplex]|nr:hypothetical protein IWQ61_003030 [Dispira simplex]
MHTALLATTTVLGTGLLVMGVPAPQSGGNSKAVALPPGELASVDFGKPMSLPSQLPRGVTTEQGNIQDQTSATVRSSPSPTQLEVANEKGGNGSIGPSGISIQDSQDPVGSTSHKISMPPNMNSNGGINNMNKPSSSMGSESNIPMSSGGRYSDRLDPQSSSSTVGRKNSTNSTATVDDSVPTDTGNFASLSTSFTIAAGIIPLIAACFMY